jgi:hypothetical protein
MRIDDSHIRAKLKNVSECARAPVLRWYQFRLFTIFAVTLLIGILCLPLTRWPRLSLLFWGVLLQIFFTILLLRAWHRLREQVPSYDIFDPKYLLFSILFFAAVTITFLWPQLAIALLAAVPPVAITDYLYRKYMAPSPRGIVFLCGMTCCVCLAWAGYVVVIGSGPTMIVINPLGPRGGPLSGWWLNYWIEWGHYFSKPR